MVDYIQASLHQLCKPELSVRASQGEILCESFNASSLTLKYFSFNYQKCHQCGFQQAANCYLTFKGA